MKPNELPSECYWAFRAGRYQAWRDEYIKIARERTGEVRSMCVRFARSWNRDYLRAMRYASEDARRG